MGKMITFNKRCCTGFISWLTEKCKVGSCDTIPTPPQVTSQFNSHIGNDLSAGKVPTIFAEVQQLSFNGNGSPNIIIVKPSPAASEIGSNDSFPDTGRWAFPLSSRIQVEDLQQGDDDDVTTSHANSNALASDHSMKAGKMVAWKPSSHLHKYFRIMHICGTAPLPIKHVSTLESDCNWKVCAKIQRAFFWIVVACTAFDLACQSKLWLFTFLTGDGFNAFVKFAFCLISTGTAIQFAFLLCRDHDMAKMINIMSAYEENDNYTPWMQNAAIVLGILTAVLSFALQILSFGMWDGSFLETILYSSHSLSQDLFLWNFKNMTSTNDQLFDQFFDLTAANICLGIALLIRDFLSSLFMGMVWDLILIVNLVLSSWKHVFVVNHVMQVVDNVGPPNSLEASTLQTTRAAVFRKWRAYKAVYQFVNIFFGPFLPLFHVTNVLMYADFLSICILPNERSTTIVYISYIYDIVKAEITYAISSRLTQQDEILRKLIRNWGMRTGKVTVDGEDWDLNGLLDELNSEPMVFGTGNFAINQRFHFGIIGLVGSLFVSLANGIGKISSGS